MNGPEHYAEAERLLVSCQLPWTNPSDDSELYAAVGGDIDGGLDTCRNALMAAQVHATLALAAAARYTLTQSDQGGTDRGEIHSDGTWEPVLRPTTKEATDG
jgi:hypothetical protein